MHPSSKHWSQNANLIYFSSIIDNMLCLHECEVPMIPTKLGFQRRPRYSHTAVWPQLWCRFMLTWLWYQLSKGWKCHQIFRSCYGVEQFALSANCSITRIQLDSRLINEHTIRLFKDSATQTNIRSTRRLGKSQLLFTIWVTVKT